MALVTLSGTVQLVDAAEYARLLTNINSGHAGGLTLVAEHLGDLKLDVSLEVEVSVPPPPE